MAETLEKLRPHRDLQCYFERPSAVGALSEASATGFTLSGVFRQQFDWVVLEWNRDNTIEHPSLRNLPDGDLSGLELSYEESRVNCIPIDSDLYPTVDWPYLRVWTEEAQGPRFYKVCLKDYAEPVEGSYVPAWAEFELCGTATPGDHVGIAWLWEHHTYQILQGDTLESAVEQLVASVNSFSETVRATRSGTRIRLVYVGLGQTLEDSTTGANGNRLGAYGYVAGARTEWWEPWHQRFRGGESPTKWRIILNFADLRDVHGVQVPTRSVRKLRWTYAAAWQDGAYERSEFEVRVTNWTVTGEGRPYRVAGPGGRRIEDDSREIQYTGEWEVARGNFSGGSVHYTRETGASLVCTYRASREHVLYLGLRRAFNSGQVAVSVDNGPPQTLVLLIPGEDVLARVEAGQYAAGEHTVRIVHLGPSDSYLWFDFLEIAIPTNAIPSHGTESRVALATDWDTDHSMAVAPQRTAWLIDALGFRGRVNHYVGALWFYEVKSVGYEYASATVTFQGDPEFSQVTEIRIGRTGQPPEDDTILRHLNLIGDTAETVAKAFELEINRGYTAIRAEAEGATLTIYARMMGAAGNEITVAGSPTSGPFVVEVSSPTLSGGTDGQWRTDLEAIPRLNRAARDWHRSYFRTLKELGLEVVGALSMELQHGDPSEEAGIAQRYPDGTPVLLNTPALQTNFSPQSLAFWKQVYAELATLMAEAGLRPYLQFGEVQWWYFPNSAGMPYYDAYTREAFRVAHGRDMAVITGNGVSPAEYPEEAAFLSGLVGAFTHEIATHVRQAYPNCGFEVLYPTDVNEPAFNRAVNLPTEYWTPAALDCFKTENFLYTSGRNLDKARDSMRLAAELGFPAHKRSHLVGISDYTTPWLKEANLARASGMESVVLWALDQFCLVGYATPLPKGVRRAVRVS